MDGLHHLRVLIANQRSDRLELLAQVVSGLGHEVIAREIHVSEVAAVTARERPDVAFVGLGESADHALDLISKIVAESFCPVIALLDTYGGEWVNEAASRGVPLRELVSDSAPALPMNDRALMNGNGAAGVLICDDNEMIRRLLRRIVDASLGLRVVGEAGDGDEALAEATRLQPDVIMLDLAMPKRSGLEALPELRLIAPDAQIIVFSGFASGIVAEEVIALGAAGYLEKGTRPDLIVATIEQALSRNVGRVPGAAPFGSAEIQTQDG
jgi:CheY-like chemotaxis protein